MEYFKGTIYPEFCFVHYCNYIPKIWHAYKIAKEKNILFPENSS